MAAIGGRDGKSCAAAIASIVFNYGWIASMILQVFVRKYALMLRHSPFLACKTWQNQRFCAATGKSLLDLNIARAGMHVQQDAAIPNFSLDVVAGHGALHGVRMIDLQRS